MSSLTIGFDYADVAATAPNFADYVGAAVLDPSRGIGQRVQQAPLVSFPGSNVPVEIVLSRLAIHELRRIEFRVALGACQVSNKVRLPSLSPIGRKGLLEFVRIWRDIKPNEADQDCPAVVLLLIVKLASAVVELSDRRSAESTIPAVRKVDIPLVSIGIVEIESESLEMAAETVGLDLLNLRLPAPNLLYVDRASQMNPGIGAA